MLSEMSSYGVELDRDHALRDSVRIGVDTGLVVVGQLRTGQKADFGAMGDALNTAARLQNEAEPGTALVSESTQRLIISQFTWGPRRELTLKGEGALVAANEVTGIVQDARRPRGLDGTEAPLVGRETEISALQGALDRLRSGRGGVLTISGEPGIGKTRLIAELRRLVLELAPRPLWLEGRSVSYGQTTPYSRASGVYR
jgi:hypothetical protein